MPKRHLDEIDLAAEKEGNAIRRFDKEVGKSIGRVGTLRRDAKYRLNPKTSKVHLHTR